MAVVAKTIAERNFAKGTIRRVQSSLTPASSLQLGLNGDTDFVIGSVFSRLGTSLVGSQLSANYACFGIANFRDTVTDNHILFASFSDGTNNDIYNVIAGTKSLQDDTVGVKVRFFQYLGAMLRLNGVDLPKSYTIAGGWISTGGAFDLGNIPVNAAIGIEWKDRVYLASGSILYYSGIADPTTRTISWTSGNGQIEIEQEDNGGDFTALAKVPGYLIAFKERTMKRWDGVSTYPEDLIDQGTPSQEAVCSAKGMVGFYNHKGIWLTNGGRPERISKPIQDIIDAIPAANQSAVCSYADDEHMCWYIGDVTVGDDELTNVMVKYNIELQTWDVYSYHNDFKCFARYIDSSGNDLTVGGDADGHVLRMNNGFTDYEDSIPIPITYSFETQDKEFGGRGRVKKLAKFTLLTENMKNAQFMYRKNSKKPKDWTPLRKIAKDVEEIKDESIKGNWFNFKVTGIADTGRAVLLGWEFPEESIVITDNANE